MSVTARVYDADDEFEVQLASASGWKAAAEWLESLGGKAAEFAAGRAQGTRELRRQIARNLDDAPPLVRKTLVEFIGFVGVGADDETAEVEL